MKISISAQTLRDIIKEQESVDERYLSNLYEYVNTRQTLNEKLDQELERISKSIDERLKLNSIYFNVNTLDIFQLTHINKVRIGDLDERRYGHAIDSGSGYRNRRLTLVEAKAYRGDIPDEIELSLKGQIAKYVKSTNSLKFFKDHTIIYADDILLVDLPATLKARGLLTLANGKTLHQL